MAKIKNKDFIELEYTGMTKEDNVVFDTTSKELAEKNDLETEKAKFGPMVLCVGEGQLLRGLDKKLEGLDLGEHRIELSAEEGFGKKKAQYVQLVSTAKFRKQGVSPMPGMQVNIDNMVGVVKTVTGGRTLVDFNHPLSSKELVYEIKINRILTDDKEKAGAYLNMMFGTAIESLDLAEGTLSAKSKIKVPDEVKKKLQGKIKELIPAIKKVVFTTPA